MREKANGLSEGLRVISSFMAAMKARREKWDKHWMRKRVALEKFSVRVTTFAFAYMNMLLYVPDSRAKALLVGDLHKWNEFMCIFIYIYMHPFDSSSHCHILYTRIYLYICICTRISVTSKNFITVFGHFVLLGFAAMILETKGRNDHVVNFLFCHKENKNQSWSLPCLRMTG